MIGRRTNVLIKKEHSLDWPTVAILVVTYDRPQEIRRTLSALRSSIQYPGPLAWHLADDHTPDEAYLPSIKLEYRELQITYTVTDRQGWGANVNKALRYCWDHYGDFCFLCEDDYVAKTELDLRLGVLLLQHAKALGAIRYDGLHGHELDLALREIKTPVEKVSTLIILESSPHLNIYSNRPHLKHRRLHDGYGMYKEGIRLGETESEFAHRVKDQYAGNPKIGALTTGIPRAFDHIGKSRQLSALDTGGSG